MKLSITIEYKSGESATYIAQPPEWAKWEKATGHTIAKAQDNIGIWDLMFLAYNAYKRESVGASEPLCGPKRAPSRLRAIRARARQRHPRSSARRP